MAKRVVIISDDDYCEALTCLERAEEVLGTMRKTSKRQETERWLKYVKNKLTERDDIEDRIDHLEFLFHAH